MDAWSSRRSFVRMPFSMVKIQIIPKVSVLQSSYVSIKFRVLTQPRYLRGCVHFAPISDYAYSYVCAFQTKCNYATYPDIG